MLKARSGDDLFFGLSERNVELLKQGRPIAVNLSDLGLKGRVMIFYGATEESMRRDLEKEGVILVPVFSEPPQP